MGFNRGCTPRSAIVHGKKQVFGWHPAAWQGAISGGMGRSFAAEGLWPHVSGALVAYKHSCVKSATLEELSYGGKYPGLDDFINLTDNWCLDVPWLVS